MRLKNVCIKEEFNKPLTHRYEVSLYLCLNKNTEIMIPIIEDDVLFYNEDDLRNFRFEKQKESLFIYRGSEIPSTDSKIGELFYHLDEEIGDCYIEDEEEYKFEDIYFVYINNEVVYLSDLRIYQEWE